jgi:protein-tyrosine kinase
MSIVQAALDRVKATRERRDSAGTPTGGGPPAATAPMPVEWRRRGAAAIEIDLDALRESGLHPGPDNARRHQDEYRRLRRDVLSAMRARANDDNVRVESPVVLVTSPMPGDGKSWTAMNLALSIAAVEGPDVLLLDADPYRRTLSNALGLGEAPGLLDLLRSPAPEFMDVAVPTSVRNLHVISAGRTVGEVGDLFTGERVGLLFGSIARALAGHVVILDTVPMLVSSETAALADVAGQVLLVVRSGVTLRDSVLDAIRRVPSSVPVGLVLNAWQPMLNSESQSYYAYEDYRK